MIIITTHFSRHLLQSREIKDIECPACQKKSLLTLRYFQTEADGVFHQRYKKLEAICECMACDQEIPLKKWNEPLKKDYERAKAELKLEGFTRLGRSGKVVLWVVAGCSLFLAFIVIGDRTGLLHKMSFSSAFEKELKQTESYLEQPQIGDVILALGAEQQRGPSTPKVHYRWYKLGSIDGDNVTLIPHEKIIEGDYPKGDWADAGLTESGYQKDKPMTLPLSQYKIKMLINPSVESPKSLMVYAVRRGEK
jgi:hypothetical protein